jgi:hypothetical protein
MTQTQSIVEQPSMKTQTKPKTKHREPSIPLSKLPDFFHVMFNTWKMEHENNRLDEVGYYKSEGLPVPPDTLF